MLPVNQVQFWAELEGEIRPAGRNHYKVWTPNAFSRLMLQYKPDIIGKTVRLEKSKLDVRTERGGDGKIQGIKSLHCSLFMRKIAKMTGNISRSI